MRTSLFRHQGPRTRRGFTLVELIVAGMITVLVAGSLSLTMAQMGRARNQTKLRLDAHLRADAALSAMRRDIASTVRTDDLFYTRMLVVDRGTEVYDDDEIAMFITRLRPIRNTDNYTGEGIEYETHYRIDWDNHGPTLYQRRDPMPDEYPLGGGTVSPIVEGIVSLSIEAYDGYDWYESWDSDILGLPRAIRVTVVASGHRPEEDAEEAPHATMRTVISIDRVPPPRDIYEAIEEELNEIEAQELAAEAGTDAGEDGGLDGGIDAADGSGAGVDIDIGGDGGGGGRGGSGAPDINTIDIPGGAGGADGPRTNGGSGTGPRTNGGSGTNQGAGQNLGSGRN